MPFVLIVGVGDGGTAVGDAVGTGDGVRGKASLCLVLLSLSRVHLYTTLQTVPLVSLLP